MANSSSTARPARKPPPIEAIWVTASTLHFDLFDGRSIAVPLDFYPPLHAASVSERNQYEIHGGTVHWSSLGFSLTSSDLLQGRRKSRRKHRK